MRRSMNARSRCAALLALTVFVSACATTSAHSVIALPNGYYFQLNKAQQPAIVKSRGSTAVDGPIAAYCVYKDFVIGALGASPAQPGVYRNDSPFKGGPDTKYFVLDTDSGKIDSGLDEAALKSRLTSLGAPATLAIYPPFLPD